MASHCLTIEPLSTQDAFRIVSLNVPASERHVVFVFDGEMLRWSLVTRDKALEYGRVTRKYLDDALVSYFDSIICNWKESDADSS